MKLEQVIVAGDELAFRFSNGTEMYLGLGWLRAHCPCAACQQNGDELAAAGAKAGIPPASLSAVEVVGGYAVRLLWGDGHGSGIYSYELLQKLDDLSRGASS